MKNPAKNLLMAGLVTPERKIMQIGGWQISRVDNELSNSEGTVKVTPLAMDVLIHLAERAGSVVSIEKLLELHWKQPYRTDNALYKIIGELRKALGDDPRKPTIIKTIPKRGYSLIANVEMDDDPLAEPFGKPIDELTLTGRASHERFFTGRRHELSMLEAGIENVETEGRIFHITGAAGMGKSALLRRALKVAQNRGIYTIVSNCHVSGGVPGFWPWIHVLRSLTENAEYRETAVQFADEPVMALLDPSRIVTGQGRTSLFPLFESFDRLLYRCSLVNPLVVAFEDIDDADEQSLQLMEFVATNLESSRIILVLTERTGDLAIRSNEVHLDMSRYTYFTRMPLGPLSNDEAADLAVSVNRGLKPYQLRQIVSGADGNPLFVKELSRHLMDRTYTIVPRHIVDMVSVRLAQLAPQVRELLQQAAVLGREFHVAFLARLLDREIMSLTSTLKVAVREELVYSDDGILFRFSHALVRECFLESLQRPARQALHARAAELLVAATEVNPDDRNTLIAEHLIHAGDCADPGLTRRFGLAAGHETMARLAFDLAIRYFEAAVSANQRLADCDPRFEVGTALLIGECLLLTEGAATARPWFERVIAHSEQMQDFASLARATLGLSGGMQPLFGNQAESMRDQLQNALDRLNPNKEAVLANRLSSRVISFTDPAREPRVVGEARRNVHEARGLDDARALAQALVALHGTLQEPRYVGERVVICQEIRNLGHDLYDVDIIIGGHLGEFHGYLELGDIDSALQARNRFAKLEPKQVYRDDNLRVQAACELLRGDFESAEKNATAITNRAQGPLMILALQLLAIRRAQGRLSELQPLLENLANQYPEQTSIHAHLALCHAEAGDRETADVELDRLGAEGLASVSRDVSWHSTLVALVETCYLVGNRHIAEQLLKILEPYKEVHLTQGSVCYLGAGPFFLALMHKVVGDPGQAEFQLESALAMHRQLRAKPLVARTMLEMSQLERVTDFAYPAEDLYRHASAMYDSLGMAIPIKSLSTE